ncbi:MAG TPA: COX15/CtaA family protein [Bryobacteraceae bacterium]|jgi:heme A synthase|nr:COX15/CtaA family protein [Bryobacteraceae bacterium]
MSVLAASTSVASPSRKAFFIFAWLVLLYNLPVILWGAYVRVSFSGDGCGANWPFCNGQVLPQNMAAPTAIEFTHRLMTSLDSGLVIAVVIWAFYAFPKSHAVRRFAIWSLVFLLIEALLGAGLVLFRKVAHDQSSGRAIYLSAHLVNTLLLLAVLTITAWAAQRNQARIVVTKICSRILAALSILVVVSIAGVIAALGDMLFPASSVAAGLQQDFHSGGSLFLHLRFLHPLLAVAAAIYILAIAISKMRASRSERAREAASRVIVMIAIQMAAGLLNLGLLAPLWMQLIHLLIADVVWIVTLVWGLEDAPVSASFEAPLEPIHGLR